MPTQYPTLGYRSLKDAVVALNAQGMTPEDIADRVDRDLRRVNQIIYTHGVSEFRRMHLELHVEAGRKLAAAAKARGTTAPKLAAQLLEIIVMDGIVNAVIDDREDGE